MEQKNTHRKTVGLVLLCALAVAAVFYLYRVSTAPDVEAPIADEAGVSPLSEFIVMLEGEPTIAELYDRIKLTPDISFRISSDEESGGYRISPVNLLSAGSPLKITVDGHSRRFKVRNELVVKSFPRAGATNVPIRSGIEFTFNSAAINIKALAAAVNISPAVEGEYTKRGDKFVFYPTAPMDYATTYTVTLDGGFTDSRGAALQGGDAYVFSFTTAKTMPSVKRTFELSGNGFGETMLPGEAPVLQAYMEGYSLDVKVTVRSFGNWRAFNDALTEKLEHNDRATVIDGSALTTVAEFSTTAFNPAENDTSYTAEGRKLIVFPEPLPAGYYMVDVTSYEATRQMLLQVSDISVYYAISGENLLVWVNDAATGEPLKNAAVNFSGDRTASAVTDENGIARLAGVSLPEPEEGVYAPTTKLLFTVQDGDRVLVGDDLYYDYYAHHYYYQNPARANYMGYIYTDRSIYHTTDTIRVWGVLRPRDASSPLPDDVTVSLDEVTSEKVKPAPDGTFTLEIPIKNMTSASWVQLTLNIGESVFDTEYLEIQDFVKPTYTGSTSPGAPVYLLTDGNKLAADVQLTFFDGTPTALTALKLSAAGGLSTVAAETRLTTDDGGNARAVWTLAPDENTWYPQRYYYSFSGAQPEQENFYSSGYVIAIHRDVMLRGRPIPLEGSTSVEITTHRIDISGINSDEDLWNTNNLRGAALSQEVTAELWNVSYIKTHIGTYYDFVNRVSREAYSYTRAEVMQKSYTITTKNGTYTLENLPLSSPEDGYYYIKLYTKDSAGKTVESTSYLGSAYSRYSRYDDGRHYYSLTKKPDPTAGEITEEQGAYRYYWNPNYYQDGEDVTFELRDNDEVMGDIPGRILVFAVQDDISNILTFDGAGAVTMPFSEKLVPNYTLTGAYFDGRRIFTISDTPMYFNPEKRELQIDLTPGEARYLPGETATVTATLTNKVTGEPAANTAVLLSVVDEAVFAVAEQYLDLLSSFYRSVYYPTIHTFTTYNQFALETGPGEKGGGGGGGEDMRKDFLDTAAFLTATTDAAGRAVFTVDLPDNITSWRLTSLAVSPNNHVGAVKSSVIATLDYFVSPIVAESLLAGDSCTVGLYSAGAGVAPTDAVSYTVTLEGEGVKTTREVSSTVRDYAYVNLGAIAKGDYTVTIEGRCGNRRDAVQLPVYVIESGIEISRVETVNLADGIRIDPLRFPISIAFYPENSKTYNTVFRSVSSGSRRVGSIDGRLAELFVADEYAAEGYVWYAEAADKSDAVELSGASALSYFSYGDPDTELTLKAYLAMPERVRGAALSDLTRRNLGNNLTYMQYEGKKSAMYTAMALQGDNGSYNYSAMIQGSDLDYIDKIYFAMALHVSGSTEEAAKWYKELVTANLKTLTAVTGTQAYYIKDPAGVCGDMQSTAAALMLATLTEHADAHGLATYIAVKQTPGSKQHLLELIYYLRTFRLSGGENRASFSYVKGGETITETLGNRTRYITFNKEDYQNASIKVLSGAVYADVYFAGSPSHMVDEAQKLIDITKQIEVVGGGEAKVGSLMKITITVQSLQNFDSKVDSMQMLIDDYIPSGMRFERYDRQNMPGYGWHLSNRQGQRVRLCLYGSGLFTLKSVSTSYYARCTTPGEFVVESAYITSATSGTWGKTERAAVTIK